MIQTPTITQFGEHAILIRWKAEISSVNNDEVLNASHYIKKRFAKVVLETVPTYHELAVYLKNNVAPAFFISILEAYLENTPFRTVQRSVKLIHIPVCYEEPYALDLDFVASTNNLSRMEVIKKHSAPNYKVYFIGFLPGFPYLGGLDPSLATPRKQTPRQVIEKGSVAIGGGQTGIYPSNSPGGWNIIGKTPVKLFSVSEGSSASLNAGDYITFEPISVEEYEAISSKIADGNYQFKKTDYHD